MMDKIEEIIKNHSSYMINGAEKSAAKQIRQAIGREFIGTFQVWTNNPGAQSLMELINNFFQLDENDG